MQNKTIKLVILVLLAIACILAATYTLYKARVDDMPGYVFGRNWKFVPESKLPKCIYDTGTLGEVNYLNPPCYASGNDVFF